VNAYSVQWQVVVFTGIVPVVRAEAGGDATVWQHRPCFEQP
jgi:hypothetical protein